MMLVWRKMLLWRNEALSAKLRFYGEMKVFFAKRRFLDKVDLFCAKRRIGELTLFFRRILWDAYKNIIERAGKAFSKSECPRWPVKYFP